MILQSKSHKRRRNKPTLSCTVCRGRKLRCDRQSPCSSCVLRGRPAECFYNCTEQERQDAVDYRPHAKRHQVRQRITRLESLVTNMRDLAHNSCQAPDHSTSPRKTLNEITPFRASESSDAMDNMGKLSLTDNHAVYVGSSHWGTILEDIRCLKDELSDEYSDTLSQQSAPFGMELIDGSPVSKISLLNSVTCLPREQILAMIPPRKVVDRHVSHFFNNFDFAPVILHRNKFLAEYANFWVNTSEAPITWIGLLFGVMSISVFLQQQDIGALGLSSVESQSTLESYRTLAIHCLVAGDYLRPSRYTIEALILHFAVDQNVNLDTYIGNWVLLGVVIRIAMRMGLHRDPSHWPNIRPLQAELRRRAWIALYQMDFFTSTEVGLPRIIKDSQCDTRPPANFDDDNISVEHDQIPPERPLTDQTPLSHIISRNTIIKVAAEIYDATEAAAPSSALIAALRVKLEAVVDSIPACLKYSSLENWIAENPMAILYRMFLDILIHKAVYLLHRRSFTQDSVGYESSESNELCINAALAILEHQRKMSEETQPGGLMFSIRWKVASSLTHEFLQATMMSCFALSKFTEGKLATNPSTMNRRGEILEALATAKVLWERTADQSMEAQKAVKAITAVLEHDTGKSSAPTLTASDGLCDLGSEMAAQSHFGSFDYEQNIALGTSFSMINEDLTAFGSILEEFSTDNPENWEPF